MIQNTISQPANVAHRPDRRSRLRPILPLLPPQQHCLGQHRSIGNRHGLSLMEVTVSAVLVSVVLAAATQFVGALASGQRVAQRRAYALSTLDNVVEQVASQPWDQIAVDQPFEVELPTEVSQYLPGAQVRLLAADQSEPLVARRVTATIAWPRSKRLDATENLQITFWLYQGESTDLRGKAP